ncbi:DUF1553 domain-containing protein [Roseiconus nitratireducens]|uniref:DUF1553 domain-containing protein n=2 Tax=Roseiconus nitratireducens TaxID=2605748 RepID=A0A5M6DFS3_9BACT|nr:DUF1553 domain-containing protein [Roseiconus nitratireducens]
MLISAASPNLAGAQNASVDFERDIAPVIQTHCIRCHHPGNPKGDVSLATADDLTENGYLIAGDPDSSHLIELILADDDGEAEMPKDGKALSIEQTALIRRWIDQGAKWPDAVIVREKPKADASWWALQPLAADTDRTIDDYVSAQLAEHGLELSPRADRRTLIRRVTYDLTGLPPTPEQVQAFVDDPDPQAYEKLVDQLLQSPRYGERWGRHWLDVVRFGESNGFERNVIINDLWPFRDYVIRSINADKPFDQFIREHIAGDVIAPDNPDVAVGSAFLVAGPYDDVGNQDPVQAAQIRANTLDEIIRATSEAFLGLTVGCARCHDHKFDPITQEDYYGLYASFAGIRHGSVPLATPQEKHERSQSLEPLEKQKRDIEKQLGALDKQILQRANSQREAFQQGWTRPPVDRTGTEETFDPVNAKFVRLVCLSQDGNPNAANGFRIDEMEVWSDGPDPRNVALARNGGKATGPARQIEDFPDAYGPQLAIDGKAGARFIATGNHLTIELEQPTIIRRVIFSSARGESNPDHSKFRFVAEYRIEVSEDGETWKQIASGDDRQPIDQQAFLEHRLRRLATSEEDRQARASLQKELNQIKQEIAKVPPLPSAWIGRRVPADAKGPFHVFLGGSPQKKGPVVVPSSLSALDRAANSAHQPMAGEDLVSTGSSRLAEGPKESPQKPDAAYRLEPGTEEAERRLALANWLVHPNNPLTPRVLANRLWHYHFGTGIVDTPSDFGFMGGRPTHPELLDLLAIRLQENGWHLKKLHRQILLSATYRQSSGYRPDAAKIDADARLLWRFPPRRLSAEEIRDTILQISGKLDLTPGGPGFRLYHFMQDNVCTYVPLDEHGPETYRRAVYHQNARASVVDLMTDFDQPDCAFSTPRRAETTTPLQALTMLNHQFTLDMADALAKRLESDSGNQLDGQIERAYALCYARSPTQTERQACRELARSHGLSALCRVLLNSSELIYLH